MNTDKPFTANLFNRMPFGDMLARSNRPGETSVLIRNKDGLTSKFIRISTSRGSANVEVEYKEQSNPFSRRG